MTDFIELPQGQSFSMIVSLGPDVEIGEYKDWTAKCQLRRYQNRLPSGLLAEFPVEALDPDNTNLYLLVHKDTAGWPIGKAELDLILTHPSEDFHLRTSKLNIDILRGVTQLKEACQ